MPVIPGQIYLAKNAKLGKAHYARPCLVLRASTTQAHLSDLSTKIELARAIDLIVYKSDSGFKDSGLKEDSCLIADRDVTVELSFFDHAKLLGQLAGDVRRRVEDWWGEPIR